MQLGDAVRTANDSFAAAIAEVEDEGEDTAASEATEAFTLKAAKVHEEQTEVSAGSEIAETAVTRAPGSIGASPNSSKTVSGFGSPVAEVGPTSGTFLVVVIVIDTHFQPSFRDLHGIL